MSPAGSNAERQSATVRLGRTIEVLAAVAEQIEMSSEAEQLRKVKTVLDEDTFWVIVLGRFRSGKSTFLNALLCELTHPVPELGDAGPLPVKDLPTTATLTTIDYALTPGVTVVKTDGRTEEWSLARFRTEGTTEENKRFFDGISKFQVRFPSRTLKSGITLLDSPGTDDIRERTKILEAAVQQSDAAIVLLRSDVMAGEDERDFIRSVRASGMTDVFFVVNRRDGRVVDADLKEEAWNRVVALALGGPLYKDQDPSGERIYFVDAKAALVGRLRGDVQLVAESGLEEFERALVDSLERERRPMHLYRLMGVAEARASIMEEQIRRLVYYLKVRLEELQARYDEVAFIGEILWAVERMKGHIGTIVDIARRKAEYNLDASFQRMIVDLCRDMPGDLAAEPMLTLDQIDPLATLCEPEDRHEVVAEGVAAAREVYKRHLAVWRDNPADQPGIRRALKGIPAEMLRIMEDEVEDILQRLERPQSERTGSGPGQATAAPGPGHGPGTLGAELVEEYQDRLVRRATGAALFFGVPNLWSELADAVSRGIIPGIEPSFDRRNAMHRRQLADWLVPRLRRLPDEFGPRISGMLADAFADIEDSLATTLDRVVTEESGDLVGVFKQVASAIEEKRKLLSELERLGAEVAHHRAELRKLRAEIEADRLL